MLKLFWLIIFRNWRSLVILFSVVLFAGSAFLIMRLLTLNIEESVARETRPLFGADFKISYEGLPTVPIIETFSVYLSGTEYRFGEIREFSSTLFDREGKSGLVNVIAYSGEYPQKGILETEKVQTQILTGGQDDRIAGGQTGGRYLQEGGYSGKVSVSDDLWNKYASGGIVEIDGRKIIITDLITKSSDLGFSFANENALIILPIELLSGSVLISSGSRLQSDLLISFRDEGTAERIKSSINTENYKDYRILTYAERSERSLDTVEELSDYILLILLVSFVFAFVVMRSAHDRLFASLDHTLRVVEILGLTRRRQMYLFLGIYTIILPLSFFLATLLSYGMLLLFAKLPGAEEFRFIVSALPWSFTMISLLVFASFFPAWRERFGWALPYAFRDSCARVLLSLLDFSRRLLPKTSPISPEVREIYTRKIINADAVGVSVLIASLYLAILIIFQRPIWSLLLTLGSLILIAILFFLLSFLYRRLFAWVSRYRQKYFSLYDALRSHVRPLTPTLPITLSLVVITTFFIIFLLFSLSFRARLTIENQETANIYAINILEEDREKVEKYLTGSGEMYSILRARISKINDKTLSEHFGVERPSGEFTREYNITTTPLDNEIMRGKTKIAPDEVSMDEDFAERLGVDIGDRIEFLLSGRSITLTIANIRKSEREGFRPFFYFSFDPETFRNAPKTYFATAYARDTELWKKGILENSGPHVTFIDIENILMIVRDISGKVLSVISLFLATISLFTLFALIALFGQMEKIESLKSRLYPLFGLNPTKVIRSLRMTRASIFMVSFFLSSMLGLGAYYFLIRSSALLDLTLTSATLVIVTVACLYGLLVMGLMPKKDSK